MPVDLIDMHLEAILRASGSALRNYSMEKSKADMRAAVLAAMATGPAPDAEELVLMRFYNAGSLRELVACQASHIAALQSALHGQPALTHVRKG